MVPTKKERKRHAWFAYSVDALLRARPDAPKVCCCPLCLLGFDDPNLLTLEDVPPKSVGGKPLVLTCAHCNHASGHLLDANIRSGRDLQQVAAGERETWIKLTQFGHTITAKATFGAGSLQIAGVSEKSDPKAHRALFEQLDRVAASGSKDWGFSIAFSVRHSEWREAVGWLRVAYLYAFAALGYNFILRPELNRVREQFRQPDKRIVPEIMKHTEGSSDTDGISFVHSPSDLRSILVRLGRNLFFFPDFNHASGFYKRLANRGETSDAVAMSGIHLDLPQRPLFRFDYEPKLMWLTVPPEERRSTKAASNRRMNPTTTGPK